MKAIEEAIRRLLRGPRVSAWLARLGIDSRRYWLLMDLFGELSDRGEILDQLGRNGVALQVAFWLYAAVSALLSIMMVAAQPPLATYFATFMFVTALLLLSILLSETGNSLVNPVEGLILAHQPVNGATYTAAKLTHLARIILYLVPGLNVVPALAGLALKEAGWSYPFLHLLAALAVGFVAGLLCCALYGWLMRLLPAQRLKAAGQLAGTVPFLAIIWWRPIRDLLARFRVLHWLPAQPAARWALGLAVGAAAAAIVMLGIRSLSADYLIRVSSMMHGGSAKGAGEGRSRIGEMVARLFGGQPARAGFVFVSRMMRRDFQFRRQAAQMLIFGLLGLVSLVVEGWRIDPFSGRFSPAHLVPHIFGFALLFMCSLLPYGNDFKGAWIFSLAPIRAFGGFTGGIYAALCFPIIVVPHALMLLLFAWPWGMGHAALFTGYSMATASVYLALELRLIDSLPFTKQVDPRWGAVLMPVMIVGGMAAAVIVGLQYYFVFRSPATVAAASAFGGLAAYWLTRSALGSLEGTIRYSLGLCQAESGTLYKEIEI